MVDLNRIKDISTENLVLNYFFNDLTLLNSDINTLVPSDFNAPKNQSAFALFTNLASNGVEKISMSELRIEVEGLPDNVRVLFDEDFFRVLENHNQMSQDRSFLELNINKLKKLSLLKDLDRAGIDIEEFLPDSAVISKSRKNIEELTLEQIVDSIKEKINDIENKNYVNKAQTSKEASEGIRELLEGFREQPEIGEFLDGDIYNYATRGARFGKFYINSAPSGAGKTRTMVGNACSLAYPYIDDAGKIIVKENYFPVLYIATEQDPSEIQTLIISYISGVSEDRILECAAELTEEENWRIETAIEIMELYKGNFNLEWFPDPTIALIRTKVGRYVYKHNVQFVFYDYIFSSPGLLGEFRDLKIREDVALMMLSNTLKELAVQYQIFIMSATQLSGEVEKNKIRNQNSIRGSKAIVDKVDVGSISVRLPEEEKNDILAIIEETRQQPNIVIDVYKNRRGKMNCIKIFRKFDYGTCRAVDLFATDLNYNLVEYKKFKQTELKLTLAELKTRMGGNENGGD